MRRDQGEVLTHRDLPLKSLQRTQGSQSLIDPAQLHGDQVGLHQPLDLEPTRHLPHGVEQRGPARASEHDQRVPHLS